MSAISSHQDFHFLIINSWENGKNMCCAHYFWPKKCTLQPSRGHFLILHKSHKVFNLQYNLSFQIFLMSKVSKLFVNKLNNTGNSSFLFGSCDQCLQRCLQWNKTTMSQKIRHNSHIALVFICNVKNDIHASFLPADPPSSKQIRFS